jgi:hypothetical protein
MLSSRLRLHVPDAFDEPRTIRWDYAVRAATE